VTVIDPLDFPETPSQVLSPYFRSLQMGEPHCELIRLQKKTTVPVRSSTPNPRRILIVDDERSIRTLLTAAFTRAGYEVQSAASAADAMTICASARFDALLSDVRMPGMSGHELVRSVVVQHPHMCCCLMSGFDLECEGCERAPQQCTLLPKPFKPHEAVTLITQLLGDITDS
jgi:DNA-binding NtrC family response regulator